MQAASTRLTHGSEFYNSIWVCVGARVLGVDLGVFDLGVLGAGCQAIPATA